MVFKGFISEFVREGSLFHFEIKFQHQIIFDLEDNYYECDQLKVAPLC